jgi:hypothetical protein
MQNEQPSEKPGFVSPQMTEERMNAGKDVAAGW